MSWRLEYSKKALKQLRKMDHRQRALVLLWMDKHIEGCYNPHIFGKALSANQSDQWRYRIGSYRVLCELRDDEAVILAIEVGHRRVVYDQR